MSWPTSPLDPPPLWLPADPDPCDPGPLGPDDKQRAVCQVIETLADRLAEERRRSAPPEPDIDY